ncbi:TetR/AcrR family transcriptional regulator [Nocardia sp. NPDC005978]|uniref:TetR/AcrR family transcriptional regulator n=1 Tax=Nocardia sp. NPDC005978 TaxID=3156725 RepID=UPI0033A5D1E9
MTAGADRKIQEVPAAAEQPRPVRRRPKNRRAMIAATAAEAFSTLGYHGVSMDDIAARLDISSTALYRHYPSKYALFREETLRLGTVCAQSVQLSADECDRPVAERSNLIFDALLSTSIANRRGASLLRWQGRYLQPEDRLALSADLAAVHTSGMSLLSEFRPELDEDDKAVLTQALFSIIGSLGDHQVNLPVKTLSRRLRAAAIAVAHCDLPPQQTGVADPRAETPSTFTPELLLRQAIKLFHEHGYPNVSVEDIAVAAQLPAPSAVYRYYRSKGDILTAAFRRAARLVSDAIGPAVAASDSPQQALNRLIELYVDGSFTDRELTFVYYAEIGNVDPAERTLLRNIQRLNVEEWAKLLVAARPQLAPQEARLLVHTALTLVVDLGRRYGSANPACSRSRVAHLMRAILFGREA